LFYLVAEPIESTSLTAGAKLSTSADAETYAIEDAVSKFPNVVQAVCQIDHNGPGGITRVAFDENGRHELRVPQIDQNASPGNRDTIRRFLSAASKAYPSDHQMVVFWGHSFGPAGMFMTEQPARMASPLVLSSRQRRAMSARTSVPAADLAIPGTDIPAKRVLSIPDLASTLTAVTGHAHKHLDLVLFKDCFMNTLEVAYELSPVVDFQLGTQDEIPIFKKPTADNELEPAIWPYDKLFAALADNVSGADAPKQAGLGMLDALAGFYTDSNNRGDRKDVPMSLLDLRHLDDVTPALNEFVEGSKVKNLVGVADRSRKIFSASAGDPALIDVLRLCEAFKTAGADLEAVIRQHIVGSQSKSDAFTGMSLFYSPATLEPEGIVMTGLSIDDYSLLRIARTTEWNELAAFNALQQPA